MLSRISCVQLSATPWTVDCQAPLSITLSRQKYWSGLPCPPPGELPNPGIKLESPALQTDSLPAELPGNPWRQQVTVKRIFSRVMRQSMIEEGATEKEEKL